MRRRELGSLDTRARPEAKLPRRKREVKRELGPDEFMGTAEAAEFLGVEAPRIGRWRTKEADGKQKKLPDPVVVLKMGPIFLREHLKQVKQWMDSGGKRGISPDEIDVTPLDLVGTGEVGDLLDLKKDRVSVWMSQGIIPAPIVKVRAGPLWWKPDIKPLKRERERRRRRTPEAAAS